MTNVKIKVDPQETNGIKVNTTATAMTINAVGDVGGIELKTVPVKILNPDGLNCNAYAQTIKDDATKFNNISLRNVTEKQVDAVVSNYWSTACVINVSIIGVDSTKTITAVAKSGSNAGFVGNQTYNNYKNALYLLVSNSGDLDDEEITITIGD